MARIMGYVLGGLLVVAGCGEMEPDAAAMAVQTSELAHHPSKGPRHDDDEGRIRCPKETPAALNPPADATLKVALAARGVQIYVCAAPAAGGAPAWTLKAPHAVLSQGNGEEAAIHFAGPSWQALDGSLVTGARTASAPGSDAAAIPWLLLKAATNVGAGLFSDVTWIQRLDTVGGVAPATGCDATHVDAQVLVPYTANYFFYKTAEAGKHVRQCAAHP